MKTHLITDESPIVGRFAQSVCKKECEILKEIPTDADLQDFDIRSLTKCAACGEGKLGRFVYVGKLKPVGKSD